MMARTGVFRALLKSQFVPSWSLFLDVVIILVGTANSVCKKRRNGTFPKKREESQVFTLSKHLSNVKG